MFSFGYNGTRNILLAGAMTLSRRGVLAGLALLAASGARADEPAQIYAAMTFRPALQKVLAAYQGTGGSAVAIYAPTPALVRQLANGAPADILLTADPMWMQQAVTQGLVRPETRSILIANELVLAGPAGSPAVGMIGGDFPLRSLLGDGKLAMCDPEHDPAGRYGKQSLEALKLWQSAASHVAIAESVPAAVVMVDRGEAKAVVAFRTDLIGDPHATVIGTFPAASHKPIVYPIALAKQPRSPEAAAALAFLKSAAALKIFYGFGYTPAP